MKVIRLAALALIGLLAVALAGVGRPESARGVEPSSEGAITVSGLGVVTSIPNRAEFSFGVENRGRTAREAIAANTAELRRVIAALKDAGVSGDDIQTQHVSISPVTSGDGQTIVGYAASNTVAAKLREVASAGAIIDAAVAAGANHVYGPSLTRSDQDELYRQALRAAISDARAKAQTIAAASGVTLGKVTSVSEAGGAPEPVPVAADEAASRSAAPVPVEPGTTKTHASVTVTFALR